MSFCACLAIIYKVDQLEKCFAFMCSSILHLKTQICLPEAELICYTKKTKTEICSVFYAAWLIP